MALFRPRRSSESTVPDEPEMTETEPTRDHGPWDITEQPDLDGRIDFGALRIRVPQGYGVQRPTNDTNGTVPVVIVRGPEGALRLRLFAAPKNGGMWDELRGDVVREVTERDGKANELEGPFGTEAYCVLPITDAEGKKLLQPSRVIGVDGPRWTVRGTFLGPVAKEPRNDGDLMGVFTDLVVTRGSEARRAGEVLPLTLPKGASAQADSDASSDVDS